MGASQAVPDPVADVAQPLFVRLRDTLRTDILRGVLPAGSQLPSERELIERHGVSRITVRQALRELRAEGLVATVNGKGSYVASPARSRAWGPMVGVLDVMRRRGHVVHARLLAHETVAADDRIAAALDVEPGAPVGALTVARFRDDVPFAIGTTWSDPALAARLAAEDLSQTDMMVVLESKLGVRVDRTRVRVTALVADAKLARRLKLAAGAAVLRITMQCVDHDGRPLYYAETDCRPDLMDYRVTLRRDHD